MTSKSFAYWLQGFFEVAEPTEINEKQTEMIKKHLALVFKHEIDPSMGDEKHQEELNKIHNDGTGNVDYNLHTTTSNSGKQNDLSSGKTLLRC